MKILGEYVILASQGEETKLISSGFPLTQPGGETVLTKPQRFRISPGRNYGEIIMQVKRVPGAKSYMYQYTSDPLTKDSVWESIGSTRCKAVIKGLPLGQKIWFRMAAIGPNGQVVYTEPVWRYIS